MQRGNEQAAIELAVDRCDIESEPRATAIAVVSLEQGETAAQIGNCDAGLE